SHHSAFSSRFSGCCTCTGIAFFDERTCQEAEPFAMNWPSSSDFSDAMQHPERWLKDPHLRRCKAEKNKMGVPRARSGAFANVYKLIDGGKATAVRVFLYANPEPEERFRILHDH